MSVDGSEKLKSLIHWIGEWEKDGVRKELAMGWLAEPQLSFADIALKLGFADTSSFYKAFRKWSGTNPGHYRSLMLDDVTAPVTQPRLRE